MCKRHILPNCDDSLWNTQKIVLGREGTVNLGGEGVCVCVSQFQDQKCHACSGHFWNLFTFKTLGLAALCLPACDNLPVWEEVCQTKTTSSLDIILHSATLQTEKCWKLLRLWIVLSICGLPSQTDTDGSKYDSWQSSILPVNWIAIMMVQSQHYEIALLMNGLAELLTVFLDCSLEFQVLVGSTISCSPLGSLQQLLRLCLSRTEWVHLTCEKCTGAKSGFLCTYRPL